MLQDSINTSNTRRISVRAGGFSISISPTETLAWLNDAVPVEDPAPGDIEEMIGVFRSYERQPRLEFFTQLWPHVPKQLEDFGFVLKETQPAMLMSNGSWQGYPTAIDVELAGPDSAAAVNRVGHQVFEAPGDPDPAREEAIRESLARGSSSAAYATVDGEVAGVGRAVGTDKVREIVSVATLPAFRRRGIASAVTARLLEDFFDAGGQYAWLTAADDAAMAVYAKLGFQEIAEQCCYVLPGPS